MEDIKPIWKDIKYTCLRGINFAFVRDDRFIERTSDEVIDKAGHNGLVYEIALKRVGYIQTYSNKETEIFWFEPKMEIKNIDDFVNLVKIFKQACSEYKNYCYYDLCHDIGYCDPNKPRLTTEDEGPVKEIIISKSNINERMYYYQNKKTIAKIGSDSEALNDVYFSKVNDFTAFAEEVAQYCAENKLSYTEYINSDYVKQHWALRKNFVYEGKEMKANVLAVSFCCPGNAAIVYYDNKKTMLLTIEKYKDYKDDDNFCKNSFIPVKLDKDFETAEEFQQWLKHHVKPYCQDYKTDYVGFVDNLNKEYDKRLVEELNQLENDKQLDRLAGMPNNRENEGRQQ